MAFWYCSEVLAGRVPHCKEERLACERFLRMVGEARTGKAAFVFSSGHVCDVCSFIEKLPHVRGFTGTILLEPVQCFWLSAIFGFRDRGTLSRYVREASLWVPRKNTKTILSVGIALFCANCEGETGAEIVIAAGSETQAHIPYNALRDMLEKDPELRQAFGAHDTRDFTEFKKTGGSVQLGTSRAKNLDGYNPHMILAEELHAQNQDVIGVLRTAQAARSNPLNLSISTAGRDVGSAAYTDWLHCKAVLEGRLKSPRLFTVIYAATKDDEARRYDARMIEAVNPMYGVALTPTGIETEIMESRKSESKLQEYKRTRLNIWSRAAGNLISVEDWDRCADPKLKLDVFRGYPVYVGLDLAARLDLNAASYMVQVDQTVYATSMYWLGRNCPRMKDDKFADAFLKWSTDGYLRLTDAFGGQYVDFRTILAEIIAELKGHNVVGIGVDDQQANMMAAELETAGYEIFIFRKNARQITPATEDLVGRTTDTTLLQHDGNPITSWCAGNVVGRWDSNENVLPKKETPRSTANIDGIDALIMANSLRMAHHGGTLHKNDKVAPDNPYMTRGLAGTIRAA